jgi:FMN-dependent NADH-azoreductase
MSTALVITSSALGEASVSSQLVAETVASLRSHDPGLRVIGRDLGRNPIPHLDFDSATALRGEPVNEAQAAARSLSDGLIAELKAADTLIIGAPMYNFGMPSTLKAWFDHVLRAGITFRYSENGPEGLLKGKRAMVIESRGGLYSEGPAQQMDSQEPHLRNLLGFMGITDVIFLRAEKLAFGPEAREQAIDAVRRQIEGTIGDACRKAA